MQLTYKISLWLFGIFFMVSCQGNNKSEQTEASPKIIERFIPETLTTESQDTLLADSGVKVSISKTALETFVEQEFEDESGINKIKYRDFKYRLTIHLQNEMLIDTTFQKQTFADSLGTDFMDIAVFHGYFFDEVTANESVFTAVVGQPETSWVYAFNHFVDLKTKKFRIVVLEEN